jgi:WD40 repeat protein
LARRIVSISISRFATAGLAPLPFALAAGAELRRVAAAHGYEIIEPLVEEPSAAQLADAVRSAIEATGPGDQLIVHVLSHGREHAGSVQVYGSDGRAGAATGLDSWLADASGPDEGEDPLGRPEDASVAGPWFLFLVDVCGAGRAARLRWQSEIADDRRRAWVVAGCLPRRPGFNGRLTRASTRVLGDLAALDIHPALRHVPLDRVAQAIRDEVNRIARVEEDGYPQEVVATRVDIASRLRWPPFFDNPNYCRTVTGAVPGDLRQFAAAVEELFDAWHFMSRAAGRVPQDDRPLLGGTFRGRARQLRVLTGWLTDAPARDNLHVVTGKPGIGKSAILGMVVCAAHPRLADSTRPLWWERRDELPSVLPELVAVHAREQDTATVLRQAAGQLELSDPNRTWTVPAFVGELRDRPVRPVLVVDAVDEAVDVAELVAALRALSDATADDGTPVCRLLVGSRSGPQWPAVSPLIERAGSVGALTDLDDEPPERLLADLAGYVDDLLRTHPDYRDGARAAVRATLARGVAGRLVGPGPSDEGPGSGEFLVAGIFINHLLRQPVPVDADALAARLSSVPRSLSEVLQLDLSDPGRPWLRPALVTLAHSFGSGLPRALLASCAPVFATHVGHGEVDDGQLVAALDRARFYLRRDLDTDSTTLYRLFHQALTDQLRETGASAARAHSRILDRLLATVHPGTGWRHATPYLLRHAIDHAAAAGRADELLSEPEFLVHADPITLPRHLHRATSAIARAAAAVYRTSLLRHRQLTADPEGRRRLLMIDAVRHNHPELWRLLRAGADAEDCGWLPAWVSAADIAPRLIHTLVGHTGAVTGVATGRLRDGTDVAVTAGSDGTARVWDITDGGPRHVLRGPGEAVAGVATIRSGDVDYAVTTGIDGELRVWSLADGRSSSHAATSGGPLGALVCADLADGSTVAVSGGADGAVRVWRLPDATALHELTGHTGAVTAVAYARLDDGTDLAVTASADRTARVWNLATGACLAVLAGHRRALRAVATGSAVDGAPVAVTAGVDRTARVWELPSGRLRHILTGHTGTVRAVTTVDGGPAAPAAGRHPARTTGHHPFVLTANRDPVVLTASVDETVGVWGLDDGLLRTRLSGHPDIVVAVAATRTGAGAPVAVSADTDGTARIWEVTAGQVRDVLTGHAGGINAVVCARLADGRDVAITGGVDGTARVWDLAAGPGRQALGHTGTVRTIVCHRRPLGAVAVSAATGGSVQVWELASGLPLWSPDGHADTVTSMVCAQLPDGTTAIATGGLDGTIQVWGLDARRRLHHFEGHFGAVSALACTRLSDGTDVLVAGTADRAIRVWRLADGAPHRTITGYLDDAPPVTCVRLPDGGSAVLARSRDRLIRLWRLDDGSRLDLPGVTDRPYAHPAVRATERDVFVTTTDPVGGGPAVAHLADGAARVVVLGAGRTVGTVLTCARMRDGTAVAVSHDPDRRVRLWNLTDGGPRAELPGQVEPPSAVRCVDNGSGAPVLALAHRRTLRLWSLGDQDFVTSYPFPRSIGALAAGTDGGLLVGFGAEVCRLERVGAQPEGES